MGKAEAGGAQARVPFTSRGEWRYRWCQKRTGSSARLHRVVEGEKKDDLPFVGVPNGLSACGIRSDFVMPSFMSRLGARRCTACCDATGVKRGCGAPYNVHDEEPGCEGPVR